MNKNSNADHPNAFQRLARLTVTVFLNLALLISVIGWAIGQTQNIASLLWLPTGACAITCDDFGWAVLYRNDANLPQFIQVTVWETSVNRYLQVNHPDMERTEFPGGFVCGQADGRYLVLQHWLILTTLLTLLALHHRRLLVRLIRRPSKSRVSTL